MKASAVIAILCIKSVRAFDMIRGRAAFFPNRKYDMMRI